MQFILRSTGKASCGQNSVYPSFPAFITVPSSLSPPAPERYICLTDVRGYCSASIQNPDKQSVIYDLCSKDQYWPKGVILAFHCICTFSWTTQPFMSPIRLRCSGPGRELLHAGGIWHHSSCCFTFHWHLRGGI